MFAYIALFSYWVSLLSGVEPFGSAVDYGPYDTHIEKYEQCEGRKDIMEVVVKMDHEIVTLNMTFLKTAVQEKVRLSIYALKNNTKTLLYTINAKPCEHFFMSQIAFTVMNATKNCAVRKGRYTYVFNYITVSRIMLGDSFFYGYYEVVIILFSNKQKLACERCFVKIIKRVV